MTLIIQKPTGAKLVLRKGWQPMDPDAAAYISAVETADGQALEEKTKIAIDNFVLGCKADGIWSAIKASCILAGARTLTGALIPLAGTAPTNVGPFVSGDYNRKTGLVGDGSTKYLNSGRNNNADPQNSKHVSLYASSLPTTATRPMLGQERTTTDGASFIFDNITRLHNPGTSSYAASVGFIGLSRSNSSSYIRRSGAASTTVGVNSVAPLAGNILIYSDSTNAPLFSNARLAFYSIGESLDLALLDARVTDLINAFGAAIP